MTTTGVFKLIYIPVVVLCLALGTPSFSHAVTNEALKISASNYYYGRGVVQDYKRALSLYLKAAEAGDPEAQYIAGGMYFKGLGTQVNYLKAFELIYKAAKNGKSTVESQKILGESFLLGRGVPKNYREARRWFNLAADQGDVEALNELAYMYFVGNGVAQDYKRAYDLFLKAARGGLNLAQYNVGIMLYTGSGFDDASLVDAYAWFSVASTGGNSQAEQARQFLETVLSDKQLIAAQEKANEFYNETKRPARSR
ncbi:tetratricopeptide repeat protein [Desulfosediminicola flagellatus]|uniref:tetratricopeptide repeat protein n=1 Tax=Desulfosediminicola flagellatus TaxID=2569541 RepID=UPI0010ABAA2B|nr:tetratricopeptide repeat protein [Desulfosediminicola flagellatus]